MRDRARHETQIQESRVQPGAAIGILALMSLVVGLVVWQFSSLAPNDKDYPSDTVDMVVRGKEVVVYNPTAEVLDVYQITVQRLSGSYMFQGRNLKPDSIRRIALRKLRKPDGKALDMSEEGECRVRLEYWRGQDKEDLFRYCRGF
jgi:hypothetical protein